MKTTEQLRNRTNQAYADLAEFGGPLLQQFIVLLDALAEEALVGLASIKPEDLARKQGVLAQLRALHGALAQPGPDASPRA